MGNVASAASLKIGCCNIDVGDCGKLSDSSKSRKDIHTFLKIIENKWGNRKTSDYYRIDDFK